MPSHGEQPQPTYYPTPLPPQYGQPPAPQYGQYVVPLPQGAVVYPPTAGLDGVVMMSGPGGQPVAYYMPPPAPAPQPYISPLLVRAALVAFVVGVAGVGVYFLAAALLELAKALALIAGVVLIGFVLLKMFATGPGSGRSINVQARGRAKVQVHTGRGHNRGRGRR
ncbi:hypothetical protein [Streptomyces drozdowiczii]|uniref:Integral membrane protein n=1 Tax=Streptomyces drozdowiczii TaxID=202862 RepID=A0ABY6Q2Q5_9ACTN|nr:hypothetical protein [Streptomyces drozdowiczii]MCX0241843.1 hypothetical protein [Streptomyces drozdowiczii]UZK58311.1 hypothetical protein NEH16_33315 [Streptomyces drozdowiczii]